MEKTSVLAKLKQGDETLLAESIQIFRDLSE